MQRLSRHADELLAIVRKVADLDLMLLTDLPGLEAPPSVRVLVVGFCAAWAGDDVLFSLDTPLVWAAEQATGAHVLVVFCTVRADSRVSEVPTAGAHKAGSGCVGVAQPRHLQRPMNARAPMNSDHVRAAVPYSMTTPAGSCQLWPCVSRICITHVMVCAMAWRVAEKSSGDHKVSAHKA